MHLNEKTTESDSCFETAVEEYCSTVEKRIRVDGSSEIEDLGERRLGEHRSSSSYIIAILWHVSPSIFTTTIILSNQS